LQHPGADQPKYYVLILTSARSLRSGLLPTAVSIKILFEVPLHPRVMHAGSYFYLLDFITLTILDEEYKLRSSKSSVMFALWVRCEIKMLEKGNFNDCYSAIDGSGSRKYS
jgi:hypothetical protein